MVFGAVATGAILYPLTIVTDGAFWFFVAYEGMAMLASMTIYLALAIRKQLSGAWIVAAAIFLNIIAAILQTTALRFTLVLPFDNNGIFHLVQIAALRTFSLGLHSGMSPLAHNK